MKILSSILAVLIGILLGLVGFILPDMALSGAHAESISAGIKIGAIVVLAVLGFVNRMQSPFLTTIFWTAAVALVSLFFVGTTIRVSELGII